MIIYGILLSDWIRLKYSLMVGGWLYSHSTASIASGAQPDILVAENHCDRFVSSCSHWGSLSGKWYTFMGKETGFSKKKYMSLFLLHLNEVFIN